MKLFGKSKEQSTKKEVAAAPATSLPTITVTDDKKAPLIGKDENFEENAVILPPGVGKTEAAPAPATDVEKAAAEPASEPAVSSVPSPEYEKPVAEKEADDDDNNTMWIQTKIPNIRSKTLWRSFGEKTRSAGAFAVGLPLWMKLAIGAGIIAAVLAVKALARELSLHRNVNVAFIGSAYLFVNDIPRLVETMGNGHVTQDSCLHSTGSLLNILKFGNGMFYRWQTSAAAMENNQFQNQWGGYELYDFGACSVPQLLNGVDNNLAYFDQNGIYYDDGTNPCFQDTGYFDYRASSQFDDPKWDFVVISDQSKRMSYDDTRSDALMALKHTYAPFFKENRKSTPIIVQPHAFWSENVNMTGIGDVAEFTSKIYEGAEYYKKYLKGFLRWGQKVKIAPVGNAFLAVREADTDMWEKLFLDDGIHPSPYGSLLYGLSIYGTIYGKLPKRKDIISGDISSLFGNARALHMNNNTFPSANEAAFLYDVAKKISKGRKPKSFKRMKVSSSRFDQQDQPSDEYVDNEEQYYEEGEDQDENQRYNGNFNYGYGQYNDNGEAEEGNNWNNNNNNNGGYNAYNNGNN